MLEQHCQESPPVRVLATEASDSPPQSPRSNSVVRTRVPTLLLPDTATMMYVTLVRPKNRSWQEKNKSAGCIAVTIDFVGFP
jgi:hypothetical protein